jgi:4-hydroxy-tetrahydrodipicolinate reductase
MTNIAICGCNGKMGKVIFNCVSERKDCKVVAGIDINTEQYADFPIVSSPSLLPIKPDVIIDFSHPSTLDSLLDYALTNNVPVVFATTGYSQEQIKKIKSAGEQIPVFFTFNLSLGVNLLVELAKKATAFLGDQFDIEIIEKHHNQKIDAPSGTALMLADAINSVLDNSYQYMYDRHSQRKKRDKKEIGIHAVRGGTIVGEHEVIFAGRDEVITLSHSATSKEVFAVGSVNAAVFLKNKPAGLYSMSDLL